MGTWDYYLNGIEVELFILNKKGEILMGNLIGGLALGALFGVLFAFLYLLYKDITYTTEEKGKKNIIVSIYIGVITTIVIGFSILFGVRASYSSQINRVKVVQQSYLDSLQSAYITDLQKVSVVNQISTLNGDIAQLQYRKSKWYGFDVPKEVYELKIINLKEIGEK